MDKDYEQFNAWCSEWYSANDCRVKNQDACTVRKNYRKGRIKTQAQAIRQCAKQSVPKKNGEEILTVTIWRSIIRECVRQIRELDIEEIRRLIIERNDD